MTIQREYLSPNEIAEYLGVSPFTIRRYIKLGELRAVKLLGGFRVHREELQRFLKAHEVNPAEQDPLPEETPFDPLAKTESPVPSPAPVAKEPAPRRRSNPPVPAAPPARSARPNAKRNKRR